LRSSNSGAADATASKMLMSLTEAGLRDEGLVQGRITCSSPDGPNGDPARFPAPAGQACHQTRATVSSSGHDESGTVPPSVL